ncbi:hypothetical protein FOCC_FOCC004346, partial [Frankliniella occidentalis]
MDAIKKKMQAMKTEKDNASDRAMLCEQQARDANLRAEKAEEDARNLQKKIQAIENDLDQTQEQLTQVSAKLEEKEKALQNRPPADGSEDPIEDPELQELASLRCTSESAEQVSAREARRRARRCSDYPGLAFGASLFSSDTMMKFSVIRNELQNIMNQQLKR